MTKKKFVVRSFASIKNEKIQLNDELVFESKDVSFDHLMDDVYRKTEMAYPKFHKMDQLSKLGFMTSEFLLKNQEIDKFDSDKIGIVLSNKSSSLDTDMRYHGMLQKGIASPAVFVYTLPNILIGELCIRNKIKGESIFFVSEKYNIKEQVAYVKMCLEKGIIDACIGGWVELMKDSYESFLYLVTSDESGIAEEFTEDTVTQMFNKI